MRDDCQRQTVNGLKENVKSTCFVSSEIEEFLSFYWLFITRKDIWGLERKEEKETDKKVPKQKGRRHAGFKPEEISLPSCPPLPQVSGLKAKVTYHACFLFLFKSISDTF